MKNGLLAAIKQIPPEFFKQHGGGWPNESSTALVDAVFSMNARYTTKRNKGVLDKVKQLRAELQAPDGWRDSLTMLAAVHPEKLISIMGRSMAAPNSKRSHPKATAVTLAATAMNSATGVNSASDISSFIRADAQRNGKQLKKAYTSVLGLGPVTFEYFLMLLGVPGVKADRMILDFVRRTEGNDLKEHEVHQCVEDTHAEALARKIVECNLIEFDHAIWRFERQQTRR